MTDDDLRSHRHFVASVQQAIRMANREVLHPVVDPMTEKKVIAVAVQVAKRRAAYIEAALALGSENPHQPAGDKLRELRMDYEESRDAFAELMTTIERGYVDLPNS